MTSHPGDGAEGLPWREDERLLGCPGRYAFGPSAVVAGMVAPGARRRGIATALLGAARPLCAQRGYARAPLVGAAGTPVGTLRPTCQGEAAGVYGFAVDPA